MSHFKSPTARAFSIEFTNTELFPHPIKLDDVNDIFVKTGMKRQLFPSAIEIKPLAFEEMYLRSTKEPKAMLFLSIHPEFVRAIIEGRKTVELRKRRPGAPIGSSVVIYATTLQCQVVATATLSKIEIASPRLLWKRVSRAASVTKSQFDFYFHESELGVGLHLKSVKVFLEFQNHFRCENSVKHKANFSHLNNSDIWIVFSNN